MSHHLFLLSPSDTPLYSLTHLSSRPTSSSASPLTANLPSWSTGGFAGTVAALSGATSITNTAASGKVIPTTIGGGQDRHVVQMIAHASLDVIEDIVRTNPAMYLRAVDKFNEWTISAFVTPGNMKFVLLHDAKGDEGVKVFFTELWELYVKTLMNPFHNAHTVIRSPVFDSKVRAAAKKHL